MSDETLSQAAGQTSARARVPASRFVVFLAIALAGCYADLASKQWIFGRLGMPGRSPELAIWPGVFALTTSLNEGGLFGFGQGWSLGLAGLSIVAAGFVLWWLFAAGAARDWALTVSLALIMAGIFGNLYDRLGMPGLKWSYPTVLQDDRRFGQPVYAVRDWLDFQFHGHHWPVFNIADSLLVVGAGLLFCQIWLLQERAAK